MKNSEESTFIIWKSSGCVGRQGDEAEEEEEEGGWDSRAGRHPRLGQQRQASNRARVIKGRRKKNTVLCFIVLPAEMERYLERKDYREEETLGLGNKSED